MTTRLSMRRAELRLSQESVTKLSGVSRTTQSRAEAGAMIQAAKAMQLENALEVERGDLFHYAGTWGFPYTHSFDLEETAP